MNSTPHSPDADAIMLVNKEVEAAIGDANSSSVARLTSIYTDNGQMLPPNGTLIAGKEGISDYWRALLNAGISEAKLTTEELDLQSSTAIEIGSYVMKQGENVADFGKYLVVWKRKGDEWKYHRDIWNSDQPVGS